MAVEQGKHYEVSMRDEPEFGGRVRILDATAARVQCAGAGRIARTSGKP